MFDYEAEAEEVREKLESVPEFSEREKKRISPSAFLPIPNPERPS